MTSSDGVSFKVGIDVGGTFTDLFVWGTDGTVETRKTLSTPADPSVGVLNGLRELAEARGDDLETFAGQIHTIVHGTTVTTNAALTRSGAKTGLLTTQGVRDALEMRRGVREEQYNNRYQNVVPLVPRYLRCSVAGRLDYAGEVLTPLDAAGVRAAVELFKRERVAAVAICFMNAFANPEHEHAAAEIVRAELPDAYVSVSTEVLPTIRFYPRVSTTTLNAYVGPILRDYLESLTARLREIHFGGVLLIMQSNGGVALPEVTLIRPAGTLLSGPAGGPRAAAAYGAANDNNNGSTQDCIVVDMGGTSFDASLVRDGEAAMTHDGAIDRLRITLPQLEITTIGAGGGSIGWLDEGGLLRMGPRSAGAQPGPACYGHGGEEPTCTDANLLLGYLNPTYFAGGTLELSTERARAAVQSRIAEPLGAELEEAAAGMYRVINSNMAHGVREITVKRGLDPREFLMVVAGGAGALHACMIAADLGIPHLLVPATASVLCATGMLLTDLQHDFVRSYVCRFGSMDRARLRGLVASMQREGAEQLGREGIDVPAQSFQIALDLRYLKQHHEVTVPVALADIEADDLGSLAAAFHREHNRLYGYDLAPTERERGTDLELINVRVRALGATEKPELPELPTKTSDASDARTGSRRAFVPEANGLAEVPTYDGHALEPGNVIEGPALIERTDTTIFVSRDYVGTIDHHGSCLLDATEAAHG